MMNKRILSFLLAVMLIVGLMPTSVFATENEGEPAPNPVIEPAGDGEDADGITPLTEEDEDIVPQNGEGEEGEGAESCTVCNEPGCEKTHTQCEVCDTWDCEKTHTQCEVCDAWDCTEHKPCALCGAYDCGGEHEYCTECDKYNCGIDHNAACDKCGVPGCTAKHIWCDTCQKEDCGVSHVWCDTCQKNDCGIDHTVTAPSEEITDPSEETTVPEEEILCDKCEATKDEEGNVVHEEDCLSLCTCEPVDGVHQEGCKFAPELIEGENCKPDSSEKAKNFTKAAAPLDLLPRMRMFRAGSTLNHEDLQTSKTLVYNSADDSYKLRLEAFLEGDPTTKERIPSDIVLVLDQSTSMCYCMDCNKDWDVRSIVEHYKTYYVKATADATERTPIYYCPGTSAEGYSNYKCGHSQGGWFDKPHDSNTDSNSKGNRYIPSIADGTYHKLKYGDNANYSVRARIFYTGATGSGKANLWISSSNPINADTVVYRKNGNDFIQLVYCSDHAAWHDKGVTCVKSNSTNKGTPYFVPTATPGEVTLGTTRFYLQPETHGDNRYQALMKALDAFTDSIFDYSTQYDLNNRMAVVTFASGGYSRLVSVPKSSSSYDVLPVEYTAVTNSDYANSLHDVSTARGQALIQNSIDKLMDQGGGTQTSKGLWMAKGVLENNEPLLSGETKRNRIVVLFTDGQPQEANVDSFGGADIALSAAYDLKNALGNGNATVYTVGIFKGADGNDIASVERETVKASSTGYITEARSSNKLMHLLSSNYTGETVPTMANVYEADDFKSGYYLSAGDPDGLRDAFYSIAENINNGSSADMDETTVVKDVITPYFQVEDGTNVTFHTEVCTGQDKKGNYTFTDDNTSETQAVDAQISKKAGTDERTIEVVGFDFGEHYVAIDDEFGTAVPRGRKLVIEIPVDPNPDFLGGDNVVTNTTNSGVYTKNNTPIEYFPVPNTDIAVSKIKPITTVKDIYISQQAKLPEMINIGKYEQNGGSWQIDGINNAYVDITYTAEELDANGDSTGNKISITIPAGTTYADMQALFWTENGTLTTHPLLKQDTTYRVTCDVVSTGNADNKSQGTANPEVKVYKPEITFQDSAINLDQTPNYASENYVSVEWKHTAADGTVTTASTTEMGAAPTLEYSYIPDGDFTEDTNVKVTVTAKGDSATGGSVPTDQTITQYVTFYRDACDYEDCDHDQTAQVSATDANRINFVVHIKSFDLKITKDVDGTIEDPNQSFLFHVTGPDGFDMKVMVVGENSVTIKGLPAGVYTVTELTDWSWRYICTDDAEKEASAADAVEGVTTVTFTNKLDENKWLSGDSFAENQWSGSGITDNKSN